MIVYIEDRTVLYGQQYVLIYNNVIEDYCLLSLVSWLEKSRAAVQTLT